MLIIITFFRLEFQFFTGIFQNLHLCRIFFSISSSSSTRRIATLYRRDSLDDTKKNLPPSLGRRFEYVPAVKVTMFSLGDYGEIVTAAIERIMIDVVYFHVVRCMSYEAMHSDRESFTVDDFSSAGVYSRGGF